MAWGKGTAAGGRVGYGMSSYARGSSDLVLQMYFKRRKLDWRDDSAFRSPSWQHTI